VLDVVIFFFGAPKQAVPEPPAGRLRMDTLDCTPACVIHAKLGRGPMWDGGLFAPTPPRPPVCSDGVRAPPKQDPRDPPLSDAYGYVRLHPNLCHPCEIRVRDCVGRWAFRPDTTPSTCVQCVPPPQTGPSPRPPAGSCNFAPPPPPRPAAGCCNFSFFIFPLHRACCFLRESPLRFLVVYY
jgi:hypothetical protein